MKANKITDKQLFNMIEERLQLQSTQKALEFYQLPKNSLSYFKSEDFIKMFSTWDEYKKQSFLKKIAGTYWKNVAAILTQTY